MTWEIIGKALTAFLAMVVFIAVICYAYKYWAWIVYYHHKLKDKLAIFWDDNYGEQDIDWGDPNL